MTVTIIIAVILSLLAGGAIGFIVRKLFSESQISSARAYSSQLMETAKKEAAALVKEAELEVKDKNLKARAEFETKTKEERRDLQNLENRLRQREETILPQ